MEHWLRLREESDRAAYRPRESRSVSMAPRLPPATSEHDRNRYSDSNLPLSPSLRKAVKVRERRMQREEAPVSSVVLDRRRSNRGWIERRNYDLDWTSKRNGFALMHRSTSKEVSDSRLVSFTGS